MANFNKLLWEIKLSQLLFICQNTAISIFQNIEYLEEKLNEERNKINVNEENDELEQMDGRNDAIHEKKLK